MASGGRRYRDPADSFAARVEKTDGCWLWTGSVGRNGYGVICIGRALVKAHRYSYEQHVGPIPSGMQLDHLCRVRHCVNPAHLEPVTNRENVVRGIAARPKRTACSRGHAFTSSNTYINPRGRRECKKCRAASTKRHQERAFGTRNQ
jgi:hypothetical protein